MLNGDLNAKPDPNTTTWADSVSLFLGNLAQAISTTSLPEASFSVALDYRWLIKLAEDPHSSESVLLKLAACPITDIRIAVADNEAATRAVLEKLARDEDCDVRYALAENHNISEALLDYLAKDENPYVAMRAEKTLMRLSAAQLQFPLNKADSGPARRRRAG